MARSSFTLMFTLALMACSESKGDGSATGGTGGGTGAAGGSGGTTGGTGGGGGTTGGAGGTTGGSGGQAGSATGGGGVAGGATGGAAGGGGFESCGLTVNAGSTIVVNEIAASGQDFIELVNTGSAAVDIANMVLADLDAGTGCPKTTEALTFASGASITPGEHLLIVANLPGAPNTPQTSCLGGPPSCYHVGFGISGSAGDGIFLLDGTSIEAHADIPANAAASGESWCRTPDATGAFATCSTPTPGAVNP